MPETDAMKPLDVLGAVHDFLSAKLGITPKTIVRGWQNRAALPAVSSYVVLTLTNTTRQGTNVHKWTGNELPEDVFYTKTAMLTLFDVQVDLCGLDEAQVNRLATLLTMLGRDAVAVRFFRDYGLSCLYAEDPRAIPFTSDLNQWEVRYMVMLRLSSCRRADIQEDYFNSVKIIPGAAHGEPVTDQPHTLFGNLEEVNTFHPVSDHKKTNGAI